MRLNLFFMVTAILSVFMLGCTQAVDTAMEKEDAVVAEIIEDGAMEHDAMEGEAMEDSMMEEVMEEAMTAEPEVLAGTTTKYYDFDKAHYEQSLEEGKVIFLNFYANWCPVCRKEQPDLFAAFNELNNKDAVGYRVHYNDNQVDDNDKELAKKFGITYQHTKVIIDSNGDVALKSLEAFSKDKAINEISKVV